MRKKVIIGSPIHQKPNILKHFLNSLSRLNIDNIDLHYVFIDDNDIKESSDLLNHFSETEMNVNVLESGRKDSYIRDNQTHHWNNNLIWKVAGYKDFIIQIANENECDYLFLIDSDLVLHPNTLQQLILSNKDIISNVFWTKWQPDGRLLPQVWMFDQYEQYKKLSGENPSKEQIITRHLEFIAMLQKPGVYEVGGLGACTLISKKAIKAGVNFKEIKNVSFWGEDRHFCIRAQAIGFNLFVDTHYPSFHIYRESDLNNVDDYISNTNTVIPNEESSNLIRTVIEGIEGLGTSGSIEWKYNFTKDFLKVLEADSKKVETEPEIKAEVCDVIIKRLENHQNAAIVEFLLINKDFNNNLLDKLLCHTYLVKHQNKWFINDITILGNFDYYPKKDLLTKNRKKEVSLVYTNYSGSNTIALYKSFPESLKEKLNIRLVKQDNTQDYYNKLISSDVIVITEGNFFLNKNSYNSNQKVIDLWHGFPLKAMGYVDKTDLGIKRIGKTWREIDFISSYSELFSQKMNECIKTDFSKFKITGVPRNDLLFNNFGKKYLSEIFKKDFIKKKCIFYMPTFRISFLKQVNEGNKSWNNLFDFENFDMKEFSSFLKEENIEFIVKLHPAEEKIFLNHLNGMDGINILTNDMLETNEVDLYEVLDGADLLITDYSSVYFDYLLLDRPIIFTPSDIEIYKQNRGFLFDYDTITPGPKVITQKELQKEILVSLSDFNYYTNERNKIRDMIHFYKDNESSLRVWDLIDDL
ncbi:CDP-glycerol glycerophosphotransferase family protein [Lysinibacillus endophyticus]|uniref:CDP-glycerol glycerophosphotransferase family protein n=1 Tax=Ureibacillus endophyticus TaxID=1978490 RepID=UPI0031350849